VPHRCRIPEEVLEVSETTMDIDYLDAAHDFDASGRLQWLGRIRKWTLQPKQTGKFIGVAGPDADGDYTIGQDGVPAHWTAEGAETENQSTRTSGKTAERHAA
jgi:hypothetical protein